MDAWLQIAVTVFCSVLASSGFWAWMMSRKEKKDAKTLMILGLGHDKIIHLCNTYIARGWLTDDEYDNLINWLYTPYLAMKGNGRAKKLVEQVEKLPVYPANATPPASQTPAS